MSHENVEIVRRASGERLAYNEAWYRDLNERRSG